MIRFLILCMISVYSFTIGPLKRSSSPNCSSPEQGPFKFIILLKNIHKFFDGFCLWFQNTFYILKIFNFSFMRFLNNDSGYAFIMFKKTLIRISDTIRTTNCIKFIRNFLHLFANLNKYYIKENLVLIFILKEIFLLIKSRK